jgi:hypothetical protein
VTETPAETAQAKAGAESLRATAKWTVGGMAGVAGAVIAGSPLTGLGSLEAGWRLGVAAIGAVIGFASLGFIIWHSWNLMAPRMLTLEALIKKAPDARQSRLEGELKAAQLFPEGTSTFSALGARRDNLKNEQRNTADKVRHRQLQHELDELHQRAQLLFHAFDFLEIHDRFLTLRKYIFGAAVAMILGFGIFAWAANPGKDGDDPLAVDPYIYVLTPSADDLARLRAKLPDACLKKPLQILVLRERASGTLEGVTVGSDCSPSRVVLHDKGTSIAFQR